LDLEQSRPIFTQHYEAAECSDGIQVEMNQLTPEEVHYSNKKLAGRKAKPRNQMRFKTDHGRDIYQGNICLRD
jgi:hypothetical protein